MNIHESYDYCAMPQNCFHKVVVKNVLKWRNLRNPRNRRNPRTCTSLKRPHLREGPKYAENKVDVCFPLWYQTVEVP